MTPENTQRPENTGRRYRLGDDREGYSEAYGEHRLELFRDNFLWITAAAFGILFGLYKLICLAKDKARRWAELTQMGGDL